MEIKTTNAAKNSHGEMSAKTLITGVKPVGGESDVEILTAKGSRGTIRSFFQYGTFKNDGNFDSFSFVMFQSHKGDLCQIHARATEKAVNELHTKAVELFLQSIKESEASNA